ncbi:WhiB family transcriptional regulator [Streptomyces cinereoruber]|uniref:WhiB family transcriptional regulator n=1 Tax=Streptomyces cinereoruber TaxID=67260 RepID=UPI00363B991D
MNNEIDHLVESGMHGDWDPLLKAAAPVSTATWMATARCAGQDTEAFFPESEHPWSDPEQVRRTQGISLNRPLNFCADCPLAAKARCLVESLRHGDQYGIRAGLLASERAELLEAWKDRVDETAVSTALRGVPVLLSAAERDTVIAAVAEDANVNPERARQGLGIDRKYLWQLVRGYKQRTAA